jgi:protein phosphatase
MFTNQLLGLRKPLNRPTKRMELRGGGYSVTGTRHIANQDRFLVDEQRGMFLVADGMGGMRAGERAAQMAIDLLQIHPALIGCEALDGDSISDLISQAFLDVNIEIVSLAENDPYLHGMGTTVVMALQVGQRMHIASLGDSRAYLLRDGHLHQYTIDHNMAQTLVSMGAISRETAKTHRWRHMLWKHLGAPGLQEGPDVTTIGLKGGDRLLLVTDGVTEVLGSRQIVNVLTSHATPAAAAEAVVRAAVASGTRDDATCLVIDANVVPDDACLS